MSYVDRKQAGEVLAKHLKEYADKENTVVIALPRGGVVVGALVAEKLHLPLDITCPHKIGAPGNPEYAIGAVTETGDCILSQEVPKEMIEQEIARCKAKLALFRKKRPEIPLEGKTVLLVDDGLATGATMRAAILTMRTRKVDKLVMAIPVAPLDSFSYLKTEVDQAICPLLPHSFYAVGQFYDDFEQTSDAEVIDLLCQQNPV